VIRNSEVGKCDLGEGRGRRIDLGIRRGRWWGWSEETGERPRSGDVPAQGVRHRVGVMEKNGFV